MVRRSIRATEKTTHAGYGVIVSSRINDDSSKLLDSIPGREQRAQTAQPFQLPRSIFDVHAR
jgi:hypothetical protein